IAEAEIPLVAPIADDGITLHRHADFRFALFPRRGGRAPEPDDLDQLNWIGRFLGRIHAVGAARDFNHRPTVDIANYALAARDWILNHDCVPADLLPAWNSTVDALLPKLETGVARAVTYTKLRL